MVVPTDDTLIEGPETIVARFTPVPGAEYSPDPAFTSATISIIDNDVPPRTVVSIHAEDARATEPPEVGIPELSDRARFRVSHATLRRVLYQKVPWARRLWDTFVQGLVQTGGHLVIEDTSWECFTRVAEAVS